MINSKRLLADARILAAYASSVGITIDPTIRDSLVEAQRKILTLQFSIEDEQKLNAVISELVRLVSPAKLPDLRTASEQSGRFLRAFRLSTILPIISVVLVFLVIGLTTNFNEISSRIAELKTLEQEHYWDKLEHAQRVFAGYRAADKNNQERVYTDFENQMSKLRDLAGGLGLAIAGVRPIIDSKTGGPNWCYLTLHFYGFSSWCGSPLALAELSSADFSAAEAAPSLARSKAPSRPVASSATTATAPGAEDSVMPVQISSPNSDTSNADSVIQLGKGLSDGIQFAAVYGLNITSPYQMQGAYLSRRQAESVAIFLGSSILPLLYGLLGASVFLMRQMFGEAQHNTPIDLTTAKVVLRLGLGGIAGLAIGWFWVPDSSKSVSEISKLSTAPFALAFLAGFSIELLFSLLDRIIAALNPASAAPGPRNPLE